MKRKWVIRVLVVSAVLIGTGCSTRQTIPKNETALVEIPVEKPAEIPVEQPDVIPAEKPAKEGVPAIELQSVPNKKTQSLSQFTITMDPPSLTERLLSQIDREKLKKYEGSYAMNELRSDEAPTYNVPLHSTWLPDSLGLPHTRLLVKYNTETGSYELIGGDLKLPAKDLSLSYEKDPAGEKNQTFLIWKKEF